MWPIPFSSSNGRKKSPPLQKNGYKIEKSILPRILYHPIRKLITESFDETNEIQSWKGGNTDFSDLNNDEETVKK